MTPEIESRIRELVANGKPLLSEQGKSLLEALDKCVQLVADHVAKRAATVRINLKQRAELKACTARITELEEQVSWMKGSIEAGSP